MNRLAWLALAGAVLALAATADDAPMKAPESAHRAQHATDNVWQSSNTEQQRQCVLDAAKVAAANGWHEELQKLYGMCLTQRKLAI